MLQPPGHGLVGGALRELCSALPQTKRGGKRRDKANTCPPPDLPGAPQLCKATTHGCLAPRWMHNCTHTAAGPGTKAAPSARCGARTKCPHGRDLPRQPELLFRTASASLESCKLSAGRRRSQKTRLRDVALVKGGIKGGKLQREQGRLWLHGPTAPARSRPGLRLDCISAEHPRVTYLPRAHSFSR